MHILPRRRDDGLKLEWEPKKAPEDDLKNAEERLKPYIGIEPAPEEKKLLMPEAPEKIVADEAKEDYLIRQLERMP